MSEDKPTHLDIVSCFRRDFGYPNSKAHHFQTLYAIEDSYADASWFEEWNGRES